MRTIYTAAPARRLLLRYFSAYRQIFFYAALFLAGVLGGALVLKNITPGAAERLSFLVGQFARQRGEQGFSSTLASSFFSTALLLAILFVCGFCAVSQPVIVLLPLFRGLGYGYQAGYLYVQNGLAGMGYTALLLLPNIVLSTAVVLLACAEAFTMANAYYHMPRGESPGGMSPRAYCLKFLVFLVLALAVSVVDALCTLLFSGLFQI